MTHKLLFIPLMINMRSIKRQVNVNLLTESGRSNIKSVISMTPTGSIDLRERPLSSTKF